MRFAHCIVESVSDDSIVLNTGQKGLNCVHARFGHVIPTKRSAVIQTNQLTCGKTIDRAEVSDTAFMCFILKLLKVLSVGGKISFIRGWKLHSDVASLSP